MPERSPAFPLHGTGQQVLPRPKSCLNRTGSSPPSQTNQRRRKLRQPPHAVPGRSPAFPRHWTAPQPQSYRSCSPNQTYRTGPPEVTVSLHFFFFFFFFFFFKFKANHDNGSGPPKTVVLVRESSPTPSRSPTDTLRLWQLVELQVQVGAGHDAIPSRPLKAAQAGAMPVPLAPSPACMPHCHWQCMVILMAGPENY